MNDPGSNNIPSDNASGFARGKLAAAYLSIAMIGAVLWPVHENWREKPHDSFPLSYYPMFSWKREAIETFYYMLGRDAEDNRYYLPYKFVGPGGLNSSRRQLRKIVLDGRAEEFAPKVARQVRRSDDPAWAKVVSVSICRGEYSVDDFYHGKKQPVKEQVKGFAMVERKNK